MTTPTRKKSLLRRLVGRERRGCEARGEFIGGTGRLLDRFFVDARDAMLLAEEEARALHHDYLGTEHLLLGLMRAERGLAARLLVAVGADLQGTRGAIERLLGRAQSGRVAKSSAHDPTTQEGAGAQPAGGEGESQHSRAERAPALGAGAGGRRSRRSLSGRARCRIRGSPPPAPACSLQSGTPESAGSGSRVGASSPGPLAPRRWSKRAAVASRLVSGPRPYRCSTVASREV